MDVIVTERGWAGHYILANRCRFRRNTLICYGDVKLVVSSVGLLESILRPGTFDEVGCGRYYETMVWHAKADDHRWHDIDVTRPVSYPGKWMLADVDADDRANVMHDDVVAYFKQVIKEGILDD